MVVLLLVYGEVCGGEMVNVDAVFEVQQYPIPLAASWPSSVLIMLLHHHLVNHCLCDEGLHGSDDAALLVADDVTQ